MGDLDVGTSLLIVLVILERAEDELEQILVVVTPLRTKDVEAKEEQYACRKFQFIDNASTIDPKTILFWEVCPI